MNIAAKLDASPRVIEDWRDAWKLHSVWINFVGFLFTALAAALGAGGVSWISAVIFLLAIVGRLISQNSKPDSTDSAGC